MIGTLLVKSIFKTIQVFDNIVDAKLFTSKLESEGIRCYFENESVMNLDPLLNFAVGGIKVMVEEEDYDVALEYVKAYSTRPIVLENGETLTCPNCHSDQIQGGYSKIDDAKSFIGVIIGLMLLVIPFLQRDKYNCTQCNTVFDK